MREIKFRAWDKKLKIMKTIFLVNSKGVFIDISIGKHRQHVNNHVVLMQYTGLKDKNGKEIYEGDIITSPECKHPYQVIYCYGSFDINWPKCCKHCAKGDASHGSLYEMLAFDEGTEVIGNIYENPELLQ